MIGRYLGRYRRSYWVFTRGITFFRIALSLYIRSSIFKVFVFISETGGAEGNLLLSDETGDESRITPLSEKNLLVTGFFGSIQYTVFSEEFESQLSIVKYFKLISVLLYYSVILPWLSSSVFSKKFSECLNFFQNKKQSLNSKMQGT